jgi:hypothetical protein
VWDERDDKQKDETMTTDERKIEIQLEDAHRFGIVMLSLLLGFATLFAVAGAVVSMLAH